MTKPAIVFFGFEDVPKTTAKVFLRTLLYSTAVRGQVIERMFVKLLHNGREQVFSFWGYGETTVLRVFGFRFFFTASNDQNRLTSMWSTVTTSPNSGWTRSVLRNRTASVPTNSTACGCSSLSTD